MDKKILLTHFTSPKNYGKPENFTHFGESENKDCGDKVEIFLTIENETVREVHFRAKACALATASASIFCDKIKGEKISKLKKFKEEDIFRLIGGKPKKSREKCVVLVFQSFEKLKKI